MIFKVLPIRLRWKNSLLLYYGIFTGKLGYKCLYWSNLLEVTFYFLLLLISKDPPIKRKNNITYLIVSILIVSTIMYINNIYFTNILNI